jgi:mycofactocin precursor
MSLQDRQDERTAAPRPGDGGEPGDRRAAAEAREPELVLEDLLVEDVSIDGMCGVY